MISLETPPRATSSVAQKAQHVPASPRLAVPVPMEPRHTGAMSFIVVLLAAGLALVVAEGVLPGGLKPSALVGTAIGNAQYAAMKESLEGEKARAAALAAEESRMRQEVVAREAEAKRAVAAAESRAQQEVAAMRANAEILTKAYSTLYDRTRYLSEAYADLAKTNSALRSNLASTNQQGRSEAIRWLDIATAGAKTLGWDEAVQRLNGTRQDLARESVSELEGTMARRLPNPQLAGNWSDGLPDPLALARDAAKSSPLKIDATDASNLFVPPRADPPPAAYPRARSNGNPH